MGRGIRPAAFFEAGFCHMSVFDIFGIFLDALVLQNFGGLKIEPGRRAIDLLQVARMQGAFLPLEQELAEYAFDDRRA